MTWGKSLVGVISDREICFTNGIQSVGRVMLVVFVVTGAGTGNGDGYDCVGGDDLEGGDVVGLGNERRWSVEEVGNGSGCVVWGVWVEGEVGLTWVNAVANVA